MKKNIGKTEPNSQSVETRLAETELKYRELVQQASVGMYEIDFRHNRLVEANEVITRSTGYSREELLGMSPFDLLAKEEQALFRQRLENWLQGIQPEGSIEYHIVGKGGRDLYALLNATYTRDAEGNPLGATVIAYDVTERKKLELQLKAMNAGLEKMVGTRTAELTLANQSLKEEIADRRQAEKKLRASEKKYSDLVNSMNDSIWVIDYDTNILDVNNSASAMLGYSREELLSMKIPDIDVSLTAEQIRDLAGNMPKDVTQVFETTHRTKDGRFIPVEVSSSLVSYGGQTVIMSIARDITKRKKAEKALRESEEKFRGLMQSLSNVIAVIDGNGTFLYMNDIAAATLGSKPGHLIGRTMHDLFPEPVASRQLSTVRHVLETDRPVLNETQTIIRGLPKWMLNSFQPIHDEHGKPVSVLLNATDIHELKTTQQELEVLNHTLEERVRERTIQVQDLYDNAPVGYHSLDAEGKYLEVNQTELKWLGYTREEILGQPITNFFPPESSATFRESFPRFMTSGKLTDFELEIIRKDGSTFLALVNATAIYGENGNYLASRSTLIDITKRKRAEEALRKSEERMELA
ncbi:MAG TPA: PAS domain S-box protein, partial [Bacteroidales bacterium]|nr:PAS domain S-box protein [Bacteroidales bacterium]